MRNLINYLMCWGSKLLFSSLFRFGPTCKGKSIRVVFVVNCIHYIIHVYNLQRHPKISMEYAAGEERI
jgi:hypothetical protein